jgi:ribonuclease P protein component
LIERKLKRRQIIRGYEAIQRILQKGIRRSGQYTTLYYLHEKNGKVGFIISKKFKKAVCRNRIRRQMREIFRTHKDKFAEGSWVLYHKYSDRSPSYQDLETEIINIARKITING